MSQWLPAVIHTLGQAHPQLWVKTHQIKYDAKSTGLAKLHVFAFHTVCCNRIGPMSKIDLAKANFTVFYTPFSFSAKHFLKIYVLV